MAVESFGIERDDIKTHKFNKWKMETGQEVRGAIVYPEGSPGALFVGCRCHVKKGERIFVCKSTKDKPEVCCTHGWEGNNSRMHMGSPLLVYDTVEEGGKTKLKGYKLVPWVFWEPQFEKLKKCGKQFPLDKYDITLSCTNGEYQTIDVTSCNNSIWTSNEALMKKVFEQAKAIREDITKNLASDLSISEIKELLGIEVAGSQDAASDVNLSDVLGGVEV